MTMMMLRTLAQQSRCSSRFFHATAAAEAKLTVEQLAEKVDLKGKNVLVRVDLNVPLAKVNEADVVVVGYTRLRSETNAPRLFRT
jgi:hypothetical protein